MASRLKYMKMTNKSELHKSFLFAQTNQIIDKSV